MIPADSGIPNLRRGPNDPIWLSTEYYLFGWAKLTTPTRSGSLFRHTFHVLPAQRYSRPILNPKAVDTVPTGRHGAKCTVLPTLLLKQLKQL